MSDSWISIFTYNPADIVNPFYLTTEEHDYYPKNIHFVSAGLAKPKTQEQVQNLIYEIIGYYDTEPEIETYIIQTSSNSGKFGTNSNTYSPLPTRQHIYRNVIIPVTSHSRLSHIVWRSNLLAPPIIQTMPYLVVNSQS